MQPLGVLFSVVYALFLWWFLTGLIIVVYTRSLYVRHTFFGAISVVMVLALAGLFLTRQQTEPTAVYVALTCGILIWGWQVTGYYLGYITGPHSEEDLRQALPDLTDLQGRWFLRFRHAVQASLFHELVIIGFVVLMAGLTWNAPNRWGLWIFLALWLMHSLAKINVFLGVRNFHIDFLPAHLHYLGNLLSKRTSNPLLPATVIVASVIALVCVYQGIMPGATPAKTAGCLFVGTMLGLGVVEHLLLVLPMPAVLWGWSAKRLPQMDHTTQTDVKPKRHPTLRATAKQVVEGCD